MIHQLTTDSDSRIPDSRFHNSISKHHHHRHHHHHHPHHHHHQHPQHHQHFTSLVLSRRDTCRHSFFDFNNTFLLEVFHFFVTSCWPVSLESVPLARTLKSHWCRIGFATSQPLLSWRRLICLTLHLQLLILNHLHRPHSHSPGYTGHISCGMFIFARPSESALYHCHCGGSLRSRTKIMW